MRIIPLQLAQPASLPKPVPCVQHAARPPRPPHTPHAASLPSCPGRGKMAKFLSPDEMTSRDYYFDSYAHFGIHEVLFISYPRVFLHVRMFSFVGLEPLESVLMVAQVLLLFFKGDEQFIFGGRSEESCPTAAGSLWLLVGSVVPVQLG